MMMIREFGYTPMFAIMDDIAEVEDGERSMDIKRYRFSDEIPSDLNVAGMRMDFQGLKMRLDIDRASILELTESSPFVVFVYRMPAPNDLIQTKPACRVPEGTYLSLQVPQDTNYLEPYGVIYHETDEPSSHKDKTILNAADQFLHFVQGGLYDVGCHDLEADDPEKVNYRFDVCGMSADSLYSNMMDIVVSFDDKFEELTDELVDCIETNQTISIEELCSFER